jgi:hypothetical protein
MDDFVATNEEMCDTIPIEAQPVQSTTPTPLPTTTSHHSELHECDFEQDLCGWELLPSPPDFPFTWNRTTGQKLSDLLIEGPRGDHLDRPERKII